MYSRLIASVFSILQLRTCCTVNWIQRTFSIVSVGIAIPEFFSNPGISGLKNADPGIESRDWVPDLN